VLQVIKFNNIAQDRILFEISNFLPKWRRVPEA
jgi:hypothetical protein